MFENLTRSLKPYAVIENVVTDQAHRKRGFGTLVVKHAIKFAKDQGCFKVMLQTGSKKKSTLKFYEKCGLEQGVKTAFVTKAD